MFLIFLTKNYNPFLVQSLMQFDFQIFKINKYNYRNQLNCVRYFLYIKQYLKFVLERLILINKIECR